MTRSIQCPRCGTGYLVDDASGPAEVWCPACSVPIGIPGSDAPAAAEPPKAPVAAAPAPPVAPPAAPPAASTKPEMVVCPRCDLHFVPRGAATGAVKRRGTVRTVLVAETQPFFREAAAGAIEELYEVRMAANVPETLVALDAGGVDLMLLDQHLDGPDGGLTVLRAIATARPCPILIFTDRDESEMDGATWDELRRLGVRGIVIKNLNVADVLAGKIEAILDDGWDDEDAVANTSTSRE